MSDRLPFRTRFTRAIQKVFWIYLTDNFVIREASDFCTPTTKGNASFIPITRDNCHAVTDFREAARVTDYRNKLANGETGFFAQVDGQMMGSIWATINRSTTTKTVRGYMPLQPGQALVHDIVTGTQFRGMGVGPFMVGCIATFLLKHGATETIIDVSAKNKNSLRMMEKACVAPAERVLYVSFLGFLLFHHVVKRYSTHNPVQHAVSR